MKRLINRKTGNFLSSEEASILARDLKGTSFCSNHISVYGYPTEEMAKQANLNSVLDAHEGYTFAFIGTKYKPLEGYKVHVMAFKTLPQNFEEHFPQFAIVG